MFLAALPRATISLALPCVARIFQRQVFFRRIDGRGRRISQVNQSLRWFVDNFALLAEWRAAAVIQVSLTVA
jgi:ABC-type uncharacterized transport system fused permease/ATPase subunit